MLLLFFSMDLLGCHMNKTSARKDGKMIIQIDTPEFKEFVKRAKIKPEEAYKKVTALYKPGEPHFFSDLYIIVDDNYLFSGSADKLGYVSLHGHLVNAQSGEISFIEAKTAEDRYRLIGMYHKDYYKFEQ